MKNRKMIRVSAAVLSAAILGMTALTGCGSGASASSGSTSSSYYGDYNGDYAEDGDYGYSAEAAGDYDYTSADENGTTVDPAAEENSEQKLIVTWNLSMETEKYDRAIAEIRESVAAAGGYIEEEDESSYYDCDRYMYLTIRIPEENADAWIDGAAAYGTITSRSKSTEDVSLVYVDMESRLEALRSEQESLMKMMEKAEEISDLITIQSELTNVNAEIESYESQLRVLDNRVNYTTIYIDINEVNRETAVPQTFWEEVEETFRNSMDSFGSGLRAFAVFILGNSVIIIVLAAVTAVVFILINKLSKRRIRKQQAAAAMKKNSAENTENTENPTEK